MTLLRMRMMRQIPKRECEKCLLNNPSWVDEMEVDDPQFDWPEPEEPLGELNFNNLFSPEELEHLKQLEEDDQRENIRLQSLTPEQIEREWHARKRGDSTPENTVLVKGPLICQQCGATEETNEKFYHDADAGVLCEKCKDRIIGEANVEN